MENNMHKGSEFNNIIETWDQNEQKRVSGNAPVGEDASNSSPVPESDIEQVIHREAAAYDAENKNDQLLGGDRASVSDDANDDTSGR
jgi:hypothetical protein